VFFQYLLAVAFATAYFGEEAVRRAAGLQVLSRLVALPGVVGSATLWVAMWYFWFNFDASKPLKRFFWFIALLLGVPLGTLLYYAVVYRKSSRLEAKSLPSPAVPA
jgi:hypothetical protein